MDKKPGCFLKFIFGSVIVLVFVIIAVVFSSAGDKKPEKEMDPNVIYTQAAQTIWAEYTEIAPLKINVTSSPEATQSVDSREEYIAVMYLNSVLCGDTTGKMGEKFLELGDNIALLYDNAFMSDIYTLLDDFDFYCTNFYTDNPPEGFIEINNLMKEVDENYIQASINIRSGISTYDIDKLNASVSYMTIGTSKMNEASDLVANMN